MSAGTEPQRVLLVDDDACVRASLTQYLGLVGFEVQAVASASGALQALAAGLPDVVLADVKMPGLSGLDLLAEIGRRHPGLGVVLLTGHGDVPMAVEAMRSGAFDFVTKPYVPEHLAEILRRAAEHGRLRGRLTDLEARVAAAEGLEARLAGTSAAMEQLRRQVLDLAGLPVDVIVIGETGAGKEVVARALHDFGPRKGRPFVAINCAAIPAEMVESELFGHEPGAFTGARGPRVGKFEHADGGTVFLDEVESMPLAVQAKVLRVIQEREVERLGSNRPQQVDFRLIAASKADLAAESEAGRFRPDLYYRLAHAELAIPPLRARGEDAILLFRRFAQAMADQLGRTAPRLDPTAAEGLLRHGWPGNVRELKAAAERFALGLAPPPGGRAAGGPPAGGAMAAMPRSGGATAAGPVVGGGVETRPLSERVAAYERRLLLEALERHDWAVAPVLQELGLPRRTFNEKLARYGIQRTDAAAAVR